MPESTHETREAISLPQGATIVVVGGGPAGSFFAIDILRRARAQGKSITLFILEKKREVCFYRPTFSASSWEGCNYCAGGISPRLADVLRENDLVLPDEVVEGKATRIVVHGDWKSIEIPIPEGREMFSVFRGSRPSQRSDRYMNLDSYFLNRACDEGAKVITAEVRDVCYSDQAKPLITYRVAGGDADRDRVIEADLAVFAAGVNRFPGMEIETDALYEALTRVLPGFRAPRVRKALIAEMEADEALLRPLDGEVHFAEYGSKDLEIEMSSLIPKGRWVTVVLLGKTIDRANPQDYRAIMEAFVKLPHIKRLFSKEVEFRPACLCHPNMTVGAAQNGCNDRIALVGDMAVSRLYKDGLFSAYLTGTALARCALDRGIDAKSLKAGYWPTVDNLDVDNKFGAVVFLVTRHLFSHPTLSRMVYQALITERKTKPREERRLTDVLWRIASGDDSYRQILLAMVRPANLRLMVVGGLLVTARNYATERLFGLSWKGFGRYPTGVPREDVEEKRREIAEVLEIEAFEKPPQVERMYSIRINADETRVLRELGRFGDDDRQYFTPRMVRVRRVAGSANAVGSVIRYQLFPRRLSFGVVLEKVVRGRYLSYRVSDGFPKGGILLFDIERRPAGDSLLTIYVAFNFPPGTNALERLGWSLFRLGFPGFVHDVLWNHSLCKFKHLVEVESAGPAVALPQR